MTAVAGGVIIKTETRPICFVEPEYNSHLKSKFETILNSNNTFKLNVAILLEKVQLCRCSMRNIGKENLMGTSVLNI
jgi:hypothetical protein